MKKLFVYDFDGTLAHTKSHIHIEKADGSKLRLNPIEYSNYVIEQNDKINFDEFDDVVDPEEIVEVTNELRSLKYKDDVFILTARREASIIPIQDFLKSIGIYRKIPIITLNSSSPLDKANWIINKIKEKGYKDVYFIDDSEIVRQETVKLFHRAFTSNDYIEYCISSPVAR